ncbi:MAG TPA: ABC transporter substrate-binding protein [Baekduia sp.]|nr:ABC transporter substrate-binding protein [Baekduia sp.]
MLHAITRISTTAVARRATAVGLIAACAAVFAACGGGSDGKGGTAASSGGTTTLKVGVIPIADVAPLYLGMKKGFFAEEHLKIEPQFAESGAAIVPSVVSGNAQIGFSNVGSMLVGQTKGLPVRIVSQADEAAGDPADAWTGLIVKGSSDIHAPKDLEGKTIALNGLHELNEVVVKAALAKNGVDIDKLHFTEVAFPDMVPALDAGRVDAIAASEPFATIAKEGGDRSVLAPAVALQPNMTFAVYFSSQSFVEQHRDQLERFQRAMGRSLDYAAAHEDEARAIIPTYSKVDPKLAEQIKLPVWTRDLNEPSIEMIAEQGQKYGLLEQEPDLSKLIVEPPAS